MRKNCLFFIFLSFAYWTNAQNLEPSVLAAGGDINFNNQVSLEWTIGEMAVTTLYTESTMITEGYHQPRIIVAEFYEPHSFNMDPTPSHQISVAPNPTESIVNIQMQFEEESEMFISIFNLAGIQQKRIKKTSTDSFEMDLSDFPPGIYLIRFTNSKGRILRTFKLSKINL